MEWTWWTTSCGQQLQAPEYIQSTSLTKKPMPLVVQSGWLCCRRPTWRHKPKTISVSFYVVYGHLARQMRVWVCIIQAVMPAYVSLNTQKDHKRSWMKQFYMCNVNRTPNWGNWASCQRGGQQTWRLIIDRNHHGQILSHLPHTFHPRNIYELVQIKHQGF